MLSIQRIKELLSDMNLSDEEAREIRDSFRLLSEIIFEKWQRDSRGLNKSKNIVYDKDDNKNI